MVRRSGPGCFVNGAVRDMEAAKIEEKLRELVQACHDKELKFLGIYCVGSLRPTSGNIYRLEELLGIPHSELGLKGAPVALAPPRPVDEMDITEVMRRLRNLKESTTGREPLLRRRLQTRMDLDALEAQAVS